MKIIEEDIKNGVPHNGIACPIANAIRRKYPDAQIIVDRTGTHVKINDLVYPLPKEAQDFVVNFDTTRKGEPFEFESFF